MNFIKGKFKIIIPIIIVLTLIAIVTVFLVIIRSGNKETKGTNGEMWSIEKVIQSEKDPWLRDWKHDLWLQYKKEVTEYRQANNLPALNFPVIESYEPTKLNKLLKSDPDKFFLLDVREENELQFFTIKDSNFKRYGDILNDVLPAKPENKKVIVLCHSGIRGYVVANILSLHGFKDVAYVRGGLAEWLKKDLPHIGSNDFEYIYKTHSKLNFNELKNSKAIKIKLTIEKSTDLNKFSNIVEIPFDFMKTENVEKAINNLDKDKELIMLCNTDSTCFDATNLTYLLEKRGFKVKGYFEDFE